MGFPACAEARRARRMTSGPNGSVRGPSAGHRKECTREGIVVTPSRQEDARTGATGLPRRSGGPRAVARQWSRPEHGRDHAAGRGRVHLGARARVRLPLREVQRPRHRAGQHARRRQRRDRGVEQQRDERGRRVRALPELDDGPQREAGPRGRQGARDDRPAVEATTTTSSTCSTASSTPWAASAPARPRRTEPQTYLIAGPTVEVRAEALRDDRRLPVPGHADGHEPQLDADPDPRGLARRPVRSRPRRRRSRPAWSRSSA